MAGAKNPFDQFDGVFKSSGLATPVKEEKGVAWEAKLIDDKLYLPIEQVLELLESNSVLPKMQARLDAHIRART